jgi:hypothetical protein
MKASVGSGGVFVFANGDYAGERVQVNGHWIVVRKGGGAWHLRADKIWVPRDRENVKRVRFWER